MITFSSSEVSTFHKTNQNLRYGQEFHQFFNLNKITSKEDKEWCDLLYNAPDMTARIMIHNRTDFEN